MSCRGCCRRFSRCSLIILNAILTLFGLALIAVALWVRFDVNFEKDLRMNILNSTPNPPEMYRTKSTIRESAALTIWTLVGWSVAMTLVGLWGILCGVIYKRNMTLSYIVVKTILIVAEIGVAVFLFIFKSKIKHLIQDYVKWAFAFSTTDTKSLVERFNCCGDDTDNLYNTTYCSKVGNSYQFENCTDAVWQRFEFVLTIAGLTLIGVLLVQGLAVVVGFIVTCTFEKLR
ncbi:unnamed protein product [Bursaphelenchus xylophilus]|uniref:(pine wood nematode) hypothetical protein n=1 Tax=Bursaphelenchus xylophilus TaxID=6326 RepID=A0A7I8WJK6_BURXY|nr:unnamed protein product [Bursaphelenchus xylophilus]CAG9107873.1 unnamed protein product [Bursaphelenchus xylophilus]